MKIKKTLTRSITVVAVISLLFSLTFAEELKDLKINKQPTTEELFYYSEQKKSPWLAVGASWFLPTLGHAYAGNWGRGIPFLLVEVVAISMAMNSYSTETYSYYGGSTTVSTRDENTYTLALSVLVIARIWEYVDAYHTTDKYNQRLREKYNIEL